MYLPRHMEKLVASAVEGKHVVALAIKLVASANAEQLLTPFSNTLYKCAASGHFLLRFYHVLDHPKKIRKSFT